tara:strand:+ start:167 stop:370 length:204 start_codon:yes stop_codon:yes gene_type:complete
MAVIKVWGGRSVFGSFVVDKMVAWLEVVGEGFWGGNRDVSKLDIFDMLFFWFISFNWLIMSRRFKDF